MVSTTVEYQGGLRCRAEHVESGIIVVTDAPKDHHGAGASFSPSDMLAVSLGSCILTIMGIAAKAMGADIDGATATVEKEMAGNPRRVSRIAVAVRVPQNLPPDQIAKLESAAHACPVHNCLDPALEVPINFAWGVSEGERP